MFTFCILSAPFSELHIDENDYIEYILEKLCESGFNSVYSLIIISLKFNILGSEESCQITLALLINKEN